MKKLLGILTSIAGAILIAALVITHQSRATVSSASTSVVGIGNGATTVFNFPFIGVSPTLTVLG